MAIKHKITITPPAGEEFVSIDDWAKNALEEQEFPLFVAARERDIAITQATATSIDHETGETIFENQEKLEAGINKNDPDFLIYFGRYLMDTGMQVSETTENV
jgi:hypothetical protein